MQHLFAKQKKNVFQHSLNIENNVATLYLEGTINRNNVADIDQIITSVRKKKPALLLNLSKVNEIDSSGIALLLTYVKDARNQENSLQIVDLSDTLRKKASLFVYREHISVSSTKSISHSFEKLTEAFLETFSNLGQFILLASDTTVELFKGIYKKGILRWEDIVAQSIFIGSQALPIIALISLLIGLTMAFQSAYQLKSFGVDVFVANLTGIAMVREMGPLMTAILVAGRSGASIAAEIATMKVSEEIDALTVMGINPGHYLAVPRLFAILFTLPLLTVFSIVIGIFGGFIVGVSYVGIAPVAYLSQTLDALVLKDLISGIAKSAVFAWGIGLIGLHYGFQVRGGAEEVGRATTTSVVASIFFIIVADSIFSIIFYVLI